MTEGAHAVLLHSQSLGLIPQILSGVLVLCLQEGIKEENKEL